MNTLVPGRNKEYDKQYYQNNKEKIKQYKKEFYQMKKEHKANLQKINHEKYKQDKILNYESNATRDAVLQQMIELKI
jgi:hypothetical protein